MKKIAILPIALMLISIVVLSGCTEPTGSSTNSSSIDIVSQSARTGYEGLDFVVYVDATVYNKGDDGAVTVWITLTQGNDKWSKDQAIYIKNGESRDLTFTFREVNFWTLDSGTYRVWVENN